MVVIWRNETRGYREAANKFSLKRSGSATRGHDAYCHRILPYVRGLNGTGRL